MCLQCRALWPSLIAARGDNVDLHFGTIFISVMVTSLKNIHARLIILDIPKPSHPRPVVTQLALLTSLLLYRPQFRGS